MASRREAVEALQFVGLMVLLAGTILGGFWLVIVLGNQAVYAWYWLTRDVLALPHPLALTLTVFLAALTVYGAFWWSTERPRRSR